MDTITLQTTILCPAELVWKYYTDPKHITHWNFASEEWICPKAENNLVSGGRFNYRMEQKDGKFGFDYSGTFEEVIPAEKLSYNLDDGRKVEVHFRPTDATTTDMTITFELEESNSEAMQRDGWNHILHNFEKYAENQK